MRDNQFHRPLPRLGVFAALGLCAVCAGSPAQAQCAGAWADLQEVTIDPSHLTAFAQFDGPTGPAMYAAGGWRTREEPPALSYLGVARWNGAGWDQIGVTERTPSSLCVFDFGSGPELVAAGYFATIGGELAPNIARWDGKTWRPIGAAPPGATSAPFSRVDKVIVHDEGAGPALFAIGHGFDWINSPASSGGTAARGWRSRWRRRSGASCTTRASTTEAPGRASS